MPDTHRRLLSVGAVAGMLVFAFCTLFLVSSLPAQTTVPDDAQIVLNLPPEMEIQDLIDYVSQRLKIKILHDEQVANKKVSIKAPVEIPASSLLSVLESALKMKGLALVDADTPGWKKVIMAEKLANVAATGNAKDIFDRLGGTVAVTQTFPLRHADPQKVDLLIKPFLTDPGANSLPVPEAGLIIVTDYTSNMLKVAEWIEMIDRPRVDVELQFLPVEHVDATAAAAQLTQLLAAKGKAQGLLETTPSVQVSHDSRTNQVILLGARAHIEAAKKILEESLDVPLGFTTRAYAFEHVSAARIDKQLQDLLDPEKTNRLYRSMVDEEENMLIVTAPDKVHERIESIRKARDVATRRGQSPMRFYKIKNLPVTELLNTIRGIEQQTMRPADNSEAELPSDGRMRPMMGSVVNPLDPPPIPSGANNPPADPAPSVVLPPPPSYRGPESQPPLVDQQLPPVDGVGSLSAGSLLGRARITADIHTNTLIVVAEPAVQRAYAELIEQLDKRRPQVLIEARLVILDTSDDFALGVEFSTGDRQGDRRLLSFSSFGLSEVDPTTGALAIIPGLGFNGTLVDPDVADAVLRAFTTHRRSRVMSAPRILVNDNAEGQLSSVAEVPFTSVNASNTVATTSFAGFAEAGTTITVTPRISDDDHLQLDFVITLNSFTGTGGAGVPPPRQTDEVRSQITIPDGHTVIVGGLNREGQSWDFDSMPFIEKVPLLRYLGGNETRSSNTSSMFIFLRPVILRDDKFRDLKYVSTQDAKCARICPDFPTSEPIWLP